MPADLDVHHILDNYGTHQSNNADPTPFVWTATADGILAKVGAFCKQLVTL